MKTYQVHIKYTAWEVSLFGVFLVRIFPHSDQDNSEYGHFSHIGTQDTISQKPTLVRIWNFHASCIHIKFLVVT